jgi:hypothetical protein
MVLSIGIGTPSIYYSQSIIQKNEKEKEFCQESQESKKLKIEKLERLKGKRTWEEAKKVSHEDTKTQR